MTFSKMCGSINFPPSQSPLGLVPLGIRIYHVTQTMSLKSWISISRGTAEYRMQLHPCRYMGSTFVRRLFIFAICGVNSILAEGFPDLWTVLWCISRNTFLSLCTDLMIYIWFAIFSMYADQLGFTRIPVVHVMDPVVSWSWPVGVDDQCCSSSNKLSGR